MIYSCYWSPSANFREQLISCWSRCTVSNRSFQPPLLSNCLRFVCLYTNNKSSISVRLGAKTFATCNEQRMPSSFRFFSRQTTIYVWQTFHCVLVDTGEIPVLRKDISISEGKFYNRVWRLPRLYNWTCISRLAPTKLSTLGRRRFRPNRKNNKGQTTNFSSLLGLASTRRNSLKNERRPLSVISADGLLPRNVAHAGEEMRNTLLHFRPSIPTIDVWSGLSRVRKDLNLRGNRLPPVTSRWTVPKGSARALAFQWQPDDRWRWQNMFFRMRSRRSRKHSWMKFGVCEKFSSDSQKSSVRQSLRPSTFPWRCDRSFWFRIPLIRHLLAESTQRNRWRFFLSNLFWTDFASKTFRFISNKSNVPFRFVSK